MPETDLRDNKVYYLRTESYGMILHYNTCQIIVCHGGMYFLLV
jgi:S-adenosylmethionine synthetase